MAALDFSKKANSQYLDLFTTLWRGVVAPVPVVTPYVESGPAYRGYRSGDPWATDQRTGFWARQSDMVEEPDTGLMVHRLYADPHHPSLDVPPPRYGTEVVDRPTGPPQDVFITLYGIVKGVNG